MKYSQLIRASVVVPEHPTWGGHTLGPGSVIAVHPVNKASPVTGLPNEIYVTWMDVAKRENTGWLAIHTPLAPATSVLRYCSGGGSDGVTTWDHLRYKMTWPQRYTVPMVETMLCHEGHLHLPELRRVVRELGGKQLKADDADTLTSRIVRLTTHKEITMREIADTREEETTDAPASKASKKAKTVTKAAAPAKKTAKGAAEAPAKNGAAVKAAAKVAPAKKSAAKKDKADKAGGQGRVSAFAGKTIVRLVKGNPRREGTNGFNSWNVLRKGMKYEQFIAEGGRREDLAWDVAKGNAKLS